MSDQMLIYQTEDGQTQVGVRFEHGTIWPVTSADGGVV